MLDAESLPVPTSFKCPISLQIMEDPVVTVDGHAFERACITEWFRQKGRFISPITNLPLPSGVLTPDRALKGAIQEYVKMRPEVLQKTADLRCAAQIIQDELLEKQLLVGSQNQRKGQLLMLAQQLTDACLLTDDPLRKVVHNVSKELLFLASTLGTGVDKEEGEQSSSCPAAESMAMFYPTGGRRRASEAMASNASVRAIVAHSWNVHRCLVAFESGHVQVAASARAFAAIKRDGSIVTWGRHDCGGDSSAVASQLRSEVVQVSASVGAFAAIKRDGSIVTWGRHDYGGDSSAVASQLRSEVVQVSASYGAFAAIKRDGSIVTWGNHDYGGDSSAVAPQLGSEVVQVSASYGAFAAIKRDGSIVTWGHHDCGGDSSAVTLC